ncbi:hypothetical protein [Raineyella sp. LH-20]|uniref:hypothetical protein n=1 Tax=Raineyella sp. LH-20 TaxID=3081204 RepID=UPI002952D593|nr:hypothetical protein [Raineyella sp. LH-20]WOP18902.1 hypothetical protein R0146_01100 [Raineyella sp. LH-20]
MPSSVAREGDVTATVGQLPYSGATSGTWTAGTVASTTASASSDGAAVVVGASCTFSFNGTNGQSPVTGTSTVTLSPGPRVLTIGGVAPLVDGDSQQDAYGNTLRVGSTATLRTE